MRRSLCLLYRSNTRRTLTVSNHYAMPSAGKPRKLRTISWSTASYGVSICLHDWSSRDEIQLLLKLGIKIAILRWLLVNLQQKLRKWAASQQKASFLHSICTIFVTIFKCIYAKENLKTNIMKSFKSTAWLLPQPVLIIGTYDKEGKLGKAIGNAFADGKQLK